MHRRASRPFVLAFAVLCAGGGCRTRSQHGDKATAGVGFELPGDGAVARGALLTEPPGREEAFVTFVASSATAWVTACRGEAGPTPPVFSFETDALGGVRPAPVDPGATARDRCLAEHAGAGPPPPGLPAHTRVKVQLALRGP
jgi:hypothetical protein